MPTITFRIDEKSKKTFQEKVGNISLRLRDYVNFINKLEDPKLILNYLAGNLGDLKHVDMVFNIKDEEPKGRITRTSL